MNRWIAALLAVAVALTLLSAAAGVVAWRTTECLTDYLEQYRAALAETAMQRSATRAAQRDLLLEAARPGPIDPGTVRAYLQAIAELEARGAQLPENTCA